MSFDVILGTQYKLIKPEGGCTTCPRRRKDFVPAVLKDTQLIVVGEAPGADTADNLLQTTMEEVGIRDFSSTYGIHCRPPGNKAPVIKELRACLNQYVADEVHGYPLVVLAGNTAASSFYPGIQAYKLRGNVAVHPDYPGQRFYTMYHPSYALRGTGNRKAFIKQVQRLGRIVREPADPTWKLVTSQDADVWERFQAILATGFVSFDFETDGVESWLPETRILSLAVSHTMEEAVFFHYTDPQWEEALEAVCTYLEGPNNIVLGHNIGFDLIMAEVRALRRRVNVRCRIGDTMHLLYLARQDKQIGLKQAWSRYGDGYRFLVHAPHRCENVGHLAAYNSEDTIRPLQLAHKFLPDLPLKTKDLFWRVSSPTSLSMSRVSFCGIGYSMEKGRTLKEYTRTLRQQELDAWKQKDPRLDLWYDEASKARGAHSGEGLRDYIYGESFLGLPVDNVTGTGKPSVDKDTIKALTRDHPEAAPLEHLLAIKALNKQEETYIEPYLNGKNVGPDGRCHSSYTVTYTDTGRPSSRNPNLQNITRPRREWKHNLRDCFVPREGCTMVQWDFSQIELRVAMCLAQDPAGIAAYQAGVDLHTATGQAMAELAGEEYNKKHRQDAKPVNFTMIYAHTDGAAYTLRQQAFRDYGIVLSEARAEAYREEWFKTYQAIRPWHKSVIRELNRGKGELTSVLGHTAYYRDWDSGDKGAREHSERAAINMTCQGTAAYITFYTLYLAQQAVAQRPHLDVLWTNTVYDSVMADLPPEHIPEVHELVLEAVAQVKDWIKDWFVVPLIIDRSEGPDWGHLQDV